MIPTILVAEDDDAVRRGVVDALTLSGYQVIAAKDGKEAMQCALERQYQLLLLDLVMPHHSGFEVLEALKKYRPGQPVIILSARGEEGDRVKGLTLGADDYVVKPFSLRELLARVDAVLRRSTERSAPVSGYHYQHGVVNFERREVMLSAGGQVSELSDKETALMAYLVANPGRAISREEILRQVWGLNPKGVSTRTIDMHVAHLRSKLGDEGQTVVQTVRGQGYRVECGDGQ